jgi:hypothetical protein
LLAFSVVAFADGFYSGGDWDGRWTYTNSAYNKAIRDSGGIIIPKDGTRLYGARDANDVVWDIYYDVELLADAELYTENIMEAAGWARTGKTSWRGNGYAKTFPVGGLWINKRKGVALWCHEYDEFYIFRATRRE